MEDGMRSNFLQLFLLLYSHSSWWKNNKTKAFLFQALTLQVDFK
jgi:hypothetical protein